MADARHAPVPVASATGSARHALLTCNVLNGDYERQQKGQAVEEILVRTSNMFHASASLVGGHRQWYHEFSDWKRNDRSTVNVDKVLEVGSRYCAEMAYEHGPQTAAQQC